MTLPREINDLIGRLARLQNDMTNEKRFLAIQEADVEGTRSSLNAHAVEYLELKKELTQALQDEP